jgi:hypothetical protein
MGGAVAVGFRRAGRGAADGQFRLERFAIIFLRTHERAKLSSRTAAGKISSGFLTGPEARLKPVFRMPTRRKCHRNAGLTGGLNFPTIAELRNKG